MKVLMLCTKFSLDGSDPWLTNELAEALYELGHHVDVVLIDWAANSDESTIKRRISNGISLVAVSPVILGRQESTASRLAKWVLSSVRAWRVSRRLVAHRKHDLVISYSPAVTMALPILGATAGRRHRSVFVLWDFFPHHQRQIGLLKSRSLFFLAKAAETFLLRRFDVIGCMSPKNIEYLYSNYRLRAAQRVEHVPIWGKGRAVLKVDREAVREAYGLPSQRPIAVFGGQLTAGRGVEDILAAAEIAARRGLMVMFLVIGDGPLRTTVEAAGARNRSHLALIERVPRNEYTQILAACDLALVCTVRNVDVPSFPSKTIDYLLAGLPIVASVEATTDFADYVVSRGVGLAVEAGDATALVDCVESLLADTRMRNDMRTRGPACFAKDFDVGRVAKQVVTAAFEPDSS